MDYIKDTLEIWFWKVAIRIIKKGYGCDCETSDLDDFHEMYSKAPLSKTILHSGRCGSCRAKETVEWIEDHIKLIEYFK